MKEMDQHERVAQKTHPLARRVVEWMAAPWIVGVEIESKEKKRYKDKRI
jgi:hypothetical protein